MSFQYACGETFEVNNDPPILICLLCRSFPAVSIGCEIVGTCVSIYTFLKLAVRFADEVHSGFLSSKEYDLCESALRNCP